MISSKFATLNELQTVYSYEDMLDLYEVAYIDGLNQERAMRTSRR